MKVSGLDVHKDTIFCALYNGKTYGKVKEYFTFTEDIRALGTYLQGEGVKKIAMESTGIYWIPVWNILEDMGFTLLLVQPYLIKQIPGRKSDVKDAQWIAKLLYKGLLCGSMIPSPIIRKLRTYSRRYVKIQEMINRLFQDMERSLELCNIRITSLVSKNNSVSVQKVIRCIIAGHDSPEELACCIHSRIIKSKGDKLRKALEGHIEEHHRFSLALSYEHYELLQRQKTQLENEMNTICEHHFHEELQLLTSIPGVQKQAAMQIIAETGADMNAFETSSKLTGWAGLRPKNDESAGKMKSTAITKGNKYLRRILVQSAWAASRIKGSYYKHKFEQLCIRKSRKKALVAIARKLLTVIWHVLDKHEQYDPTIVPIYDPVKIKQKLQYHVRELEKYQKLGYTCT